METKVNLKGLPQQELEKFFVSLGEKPFRARQVMKWIYGKNETDFNRMTDLSVPLRSKLSEVAVIKSIKLVERLKSKDDSEKFVFELEDGERIESVFIPTKERQTLCISTQAGCPMGCLFCATGKIEYKRNLTAFEIIDQLIQVGVFTGMHGYISNVVFMGMGEPLLNLPAVVDAIRIMLSDFGFKMGARKITVSTCGLPEKIRELADTGLRVKLAISLNAPTDAIRKRLMPATAKVEDIISAAKYYAEKTGRWVTFEYVLISGVNDKIEHAKKLKELIEGVPAKVNLIPYNPIPGVQFKPPDTKTILRFQAYLFENHITAIIRESRGQDILGACGQLGQKRNSPL